MGAGTAEEGCAVVGTGAVVGAGAAVGAGAVVGTGAAVGVGASNIVKTTPSINTIQHYTLLSTRNYTLL